MPKQPKIVFELVNKDQLYVKLTVPGTTVRRYKKLDETVLYKFWDTKEHRVKKGGKDADAINKVIKEERERLQAMFDRDQRIVKFDLTYIEKALGIIYEENLTDFLRFFDDFIQLQTTKFSAGYIKHLEVEYRSIKKYDENIRFKDITAEYLEKYEMSLTGKSTTKNTKMKRLKEVVNRAIERGHIRKEAIAGYTIPEYKKPERGYLTLAQTETIGNNIYNGKYDDDPILKQIAAFFLVECYSGIRFSDWGKFKVETLINDRNFKVRATKNGEPIYLPLSKFTRLAKIVDYIRDNKMTFTLAEPVTNRLLKIIGSQIKFVGLTTHIGRHTCGTLLGEMGYSTRAIADVLGISLGVAETYVKTTRQGLNYETERFGGL